MKYHSFFVRPIVRKRKINDVNKLKIITKLIFKLLDKNEILKSTEIISREINPVFVIKFDISKNNENVINKKGSKKRFKKNNGKLF